VRLIKGVHGAFEAKVEPSGFVRLKNISTLPTMRKIVANESLAKKLAILAYPDVNPGKGSQSVSQQAHLLFSKRAPSTGQIEKVLQLWRHWAYVFDFLPVATRDDKADLIKNIKAFGQLFVELFGKLYVTPYIHIVCSHTGALIDKFGNLGQFEQQGVERTVGIHKLSAMRATANGGGRGNPEELRWMFPKQIMLRFLRIVHYAPQFDPDMLKPVNQRDAVKGYVSRNRKRAKELELTAAAVGAVSQYKKARLATEASSPNSASSASAETIQVADSDSEMEDPAEPYDDDYDVEDEL
jgi:hypothetical protein